jgi:cob(I)alamin adenosyltransferase
VRNYLKSSEANAESRRRIRCCGAVDELISYMGFARSICPDVEVRKCIKSLQIDLYRLGAIIARPPGAKKLAETIGPAIMDALETEIQRITNLPGVLCDGSLFCELPAAAALDIARTISRRTEHVARRLTREGELGITVILNYLSRLTELLWLLSRLLESRHGPKR